MGGPELDFSALVQAVRTADAHFSARAARAVNLSLTLRNWFIGLYIAEFELRGRDRARYGDRLLDALASELQGQGLSNVGRRQLYSFLAFYRAYSHLSAAVPPESRSLLPLQVSPDEKVPAVPALSDLAPETLIGRLSFSHFALLTELQDENQRRFYELEAIRGQWSLRELRRQITTLAFERTALSTDKAKLLDLIQHAAEADNPALVIRDPYVFEFLGIKPTELINTYVTWFRRHEQTEGDNPPIGLLLCTRKNRALVEYALAGMDNQLFVSRYQLELPRKEELEALLETELRLHHHGEADA